MADSIDTQINQARDAYKTSEQAVDAPLETDIKQLVDTTRVAGQQQIDLATKEASELQPFTQEPPHEQINQIMSGAPFLFALAAIGGKISGAGGVAMLDSLNGMSDGIIKGDQDSMDAHYKNYQAQFDKWKSNSDQVIQKYNILQQAYAGAADGNIRAMTAALNIHGDIAQRKLNADDPLKLVELKARLEEAHARTVEAYTKASEARRALAGGLPPGWTQAQIDFYAKMRNAGDTSYTTGLARGKYGSEVIAAIDRRAADMAVSEGKDPQDISVNKDIRVSLDKALNDRTKAAATAEQFVANFHDQEQIVGKYIEPGVGGATPVLNRWIQGGRKSIQGDEDVTRLDTAIRGLGREHQRIVTGLTSNAQLHVSAAETADQLINKDFTAGMIRASIGIMHEEAENAKKEGLAEVDKLRGRIRNIGKDAPPAVDAPPPGAPSAGGLASPSDPNAPVPVWRAYSNSRRKWYTKYSDGSVKPDPTIPSTGGATGSF